MRTSAAASRGKRNLLFAVLALLGCFVLLLYAFVAAPPAADRADAGRGDATPVETKKVDWGVASSAPKDVAAASDNVFVGKVERRVGQQMINKSPRPGDEGTPSTEFSVAVEEPLKSGGDRPAKKGQRLVVAQYGGVHNGKTYRIVGEIAGRAYEDAPILPGRRYLFSTTFNRARGYQELAAQPHGDAPLTGAEPAERERLLGSFRQAIRASAGSPDSEQRRAGV